MSISESTSGCRVWWKISRKLKRTQVRSLALLSGLRICVAMSCSVGRRCGSDPVLLAVAVAVAQAGSYSSDLTPSLGTSICHGCGPKMTKKKYIYIYSWTQRFLTQEFVLKTKTKNPKLKQITLGQPHSHLQKNEVGPLTSHHTQILT